MRTASPAATAMVNSGSLKYFILVEIGTTYKWTSYATDIQMTNAGTGVGTFSADSGLAGVDPPRLSSVVDREAYKVTVADPSFSLRSPLGLLIGAKMKVRIGFINSTASNVAGSDGVNVAPGAPFRDIRDTIMSYGGYVSGFEYAVEPSEGTDVVTITGSSPLADLDAVRSSSTSPEFAKQLRAGDTSFDEASLSSRATVFKWGKK